MIETARPPVETSVFTFNNKSSIALSLLRDRGNQIELNQAAMWATGFAHIKLAIHHFFTGATGEARYTADEINTLTVNHSLKANYATGNDLLGRMQSLAVAFIVLRRRGSKDLTELEQKSSLADNMGEVERIYRETAGNITELPGLDFLSEGLTHSLREVEYVLEREAQYRGIEVLKADAIRLVEAERAVWTEEKQARIPLRLLDIEQLSFFLRQ